NLGVLYEGLEKEEARECYEQAHAIFRKLSTTYREETHYRFHRAGAAYNLGKYLREQEAEDSLPWFDEAIKELTALRQVEPDHPGARERLRKAHEQRALALDDLGRAREAVDEWDRARALADDKEKEWYRLRWTTALARAGDYSRALDEVPTLVRDPLNAERLY